MHNNTLSNIKRTAKESSDNTCLISKSYIIILCKENANPKLNLLQLRTNPPTYIELQPGKNILTVEKYPALKYGFRQIDEADDSEDSVLLGENCKDVIEIDLSHFDGSEMVSMDYMFHFMSGIEKLTFGNMKTPKLKSAEWVFWGIGSDNNGEPNLDINLSGIDFSKVTNAKNMFTNAFIRKLDLSGCNLENIMEYYADLFSGSCIKHMILDNCKFRTVDELNAWSDYRDLMVVSLQGWKKDDIREFIMAIERGRSKFIDFFPTAKYILDPIYEYHIGKDSDQNITCEIITRSLGMDNSSKKETIHEWLSTNPGKTERDWLLEERCANDIQREALKELLECCDACGVKYEISHKVDLDKEYAGLIASDSYLQEILGYKDMKKFENFHGYSAVVFEDDEIEYNQYNIFDLYFPQSGWYINIGSEIEDVLIRRWIKQSGPTCFERTGAIEISRAEPFMRRFHDLLYSKYSYPKSERFKHPVEGCYYEFLPWNKNLEANAKKSNLSDKKLLLRNDRQFWATLFKDHFFEMKRFRKERYLKSHPEVLEKRAMLLHTLVTEVQKSLGLNKSVSETQIKKLIDTVDNELSVLYPEFEEIHNIRQDN